MLTRDERRRLAEIELMMQVTDPRLANSLKRFRRSMMPWRVTAAVVGGGWLTDLVLLSTGHFVLAMFLLVPLAIATVVLWIARA